MLEVIKYKYTQFCLFAQGIYLLSEDKRSPKTSKVDGDNATNGPDKELCKQRAE